MKAQRDRLERELQDNMEKHKADMLKVLEDNRNKERDLDKERSRVKLLEKDLKQCEDSILEIGLMRPPRQEQEDDTKIKVEEPELKRFKKDEEMRDKTRRENVERNDEIAKEQERLQRENLEREKMNRI